MALAATAALQIEGRTLEEIERSARAQLAADGPPGYWRIVSIHLEPLVVKMGREPRVTLWSADIEAELPERQIH